MNKIFIPVIVMLAACFGCQAGVDPLTSGAVVSQTMILKDTYIKRAEHQRSIRDIEATISVGMATIHDVENKMVEYLTNISGAVQNLHQIVQAGELVVEIPKNAEALFQAVKSHPRNALFASFITRHISNLTAEATSLYPFMQQLVTTGTYNSGDEKKKVNVLNSYERYMIANMVVSRLSRINRSLVYLRWQVEYFSWNTFFFGLDFQTYCTYYNTKAVAQSVMYKWKNFKMH